MPTDNIPKLENLLVFKGIFMLFARYEFQIAVNIKFIIAWCVTPCSLANLPKLYGVTYGSTTATVSGRQEMHFS